MVAESRGSMRVMCLAEVPTARRFRSCSAVKERRECDVVRVSTKVVVGRSQVRTVWSREAEYATVASLGAKIVDDTGAV